MRKTLLSRVVLALVLAASAIPAHATWSIIICDTRTKEVAIGSATCLTFIDLKRLLPVVRVNQGAGAAQSFIDSSGRNRLLIWDNLAISTDPALMLQMLEDQDSDHQTRQYGIVDTRGRAITFSGSRNGAYANGLTGRIGTLVYAIQGNVITGQPVLDRAEEALVNTPGGIPEKLMAAMEAAREMGGDGRCSCDPGDPTRCGSPPEEFEKAAHVGFMVVARRGNKMGDCDRRSGWTCGEYYMSFNVSGADRNDRDPVFQLRDMFDTWRQELIGQVDGVESAISITPDRMFADGVSKAMLRFEARDWRGDPVADIEAVGVKHQKASAKISTIGSVKDLGGGKFEVEITAGSRGGRDLLKVTLTDAVGPKVIIPMAQLTLLGKADMNCDGSVDIVDVGPFIQALLDPQEYEKSYPDCRLAQGDLDGDGTVATPDVEPFIQCLLNDGCQ